MGEDPNRSTNQRISFETLFGNKGLLRVQCRKSIETKLLGKNVESKILLGLRLQQDRPDRDLLGINRVKVTDFIQNVDNLSTRTGNSSTDVIMTRVKGSKEKGTTMSKTGGWVGGL